MTTPLITNHSSLITIVKRGFTIVELLVVIGIISIIGTIAADIFLNVSRSYNKASIITKIEQSGNIALSQMVGEIRNARSISPTSGTTSTLTISAADGGSVIFSLVPPTSSANGYVARNGISLTDNAYVTGVNVTQLSFTIVSGDPPSVSITLTMTQPLGVPSRVDFQAQTTLQTSVSLRNY